MGLDRKMIAKAKAEAWDRLYESVTGCSHALCSLSEASWEDAFSRRMAMLLERASNE